MFYKLIDNKYIKIVSAERNGGAIGRRVLVRVYD